MAEPNSAYRHTLMHALTKDIFEAEDERRTAFIDKLVSKQIQATDNNTLGFIYRGTQYIHSGATNKTLGKRIQRLHVSLRRDLDVFEHSERRVITEVRPVVMGYLRQCLTLTMNEDALLKLLPQAVHPTVQQWHAKVHFPPDQPELCAYPADEEIAELVESNQEAIAHIKSYKARAMVMR